MNKIMRPGYAILSLASNIDGFTTQESYKFDLNYTIYSSKLYY